MKPIKCRNYREHGAVPLTFYPLFDIVLLLRCTPSRNSSEELSARLPYRLSELSGDEHECKSVVSCVRSDLAYLHVSFTKRINTKPRYTSICSCLLLMSGDIELNPGPRPLKYPCSICSKAVKNSDPAVSCDQCGLWVHNACNGLSNHMYEYMQQSSTVWIAVISDRSQRVVLNGAQSSWIPVLSGVPQGTVLGPLIFLLYVNDITDNVSSEIRLFADNCILYWQIRTPGDCTSLQQDITRLYNQWRKSRKRQGGHVPPKNVGWGNGNASCPPPDMAEHSLHKRQRIRLIVASYYDLVYVLSAFSAWVLQSSVNELQG